MNLGFPDSSPAAASTSGSINPDAVLGNRAHRWSDLDDDVFSSGCGGSCSPSPKAPYCPSHSTSTAAATASTDSPAPTAPNTSLYCLTPTGQYKPTLPVPADSSPGMINTSIFRVYILKISASILALSTTYI